LLAELNHEIWIGDPAQIRAKQVRKQKNDRRDAEHILKLMLKDDFLASERRVPQHNGELLKSDMRR
jgi:hypothetical protein